jgi:TM2 domain-containing membrane protein YozV
MFGRLCCVLALCLLTCFNAKAAAIKCDVIHNKAILSAPAPIAQQVYIAADSLPRKHKLIAALLAFPLGVFGFHRMYLGTSSATPLLYIATLGGLFGVLPFIDFVLIVLCKDINVYAHNPHTFMWSKKKKEKS